jgi:hypothetical protein
MPLLFLVPAVNLAHEPHHTILLQNIKVRVLRLALQPNEATRLHRHDNYYAFVSLKPALLGNEVPGHAPKITKLEARELHTSRGGFELVERNLSTEPMDVVVVELLNPAPRAFEFPMGGPQYREVLYSDLFEVPGMRAFSVYLLPGNRIHKREQKSDRIVLALTDLSFQVESDGHPAADLNLKAGEAKWLPGGGTETITNSGNSAGNLITFEFN